MTSHLFTATVNPMKPHTTNDKSETTTKLIKLTLNGRIERICTRYLQKLKTMSFKNNAQLNFKSKIKRTIMLT